MYIIRLCRIPHSDALLCCITPSSLVCCSVSLWH